MIITGSQEVEGKNAIELVYEFKAALDKEDFEMCQKIKDELERREKGSMIDKDLVQAIVGFYNKYSVNDKSKNKEYFNELFEKYS